MYPTLDHRSRIASTFNFLIVAPNSKTSTSLDSRCRCFYPIHRSQVLSPEWRCSWSSADRRCSSYIWVINFISHKGAAYIRDLTVCRSGNHIIKCTKVDLYIADQYFTQWTDNTVCHSSVHWMANIAVQFRWVTYIQFVRDIILRQFILNCCNDLMNVLNIRHPSPGHFSQYICSILHMANAPGCRFTKRWDFDHQISRIPEIWF